MVKRIWPDLPSLRERSMNNRRYLRDTRPICTWRSCWPSVRNSRRKQRNVRVLNNEETEKRRWYGCSVVIQMLLSALDNSRYTSIRQCRTIAEREAARNRAVSLTTCNGTAVSIGRFLCVAGETVHTPHRPSFSRVFHKTKRQRIGRAASRENRKVEGVKGRERAGVVCARRGKRR